MSAGRDGDPTIRAHRNRRAVHAPVAIWEDTNLSVAARMILPYLLSLADRPGWSVRVSHVCAALRISRFTWTAARKSMESCGYYRALRRRMGSGTQMTDHSGKKRGAAGSWTWEHWVTDVPNEWGDASPDGGNQPHSQPPSPNKNNRLTKKPPPSFTTDGFIGDGFSNNGFTVDGFTSDGKPNDIHDPDFHNSKGRSSKAEGTATAASAINTTEPRCASAKNGAANTHGFNDIAAEATLLSDAPDNESALADSTGKLDAAADTIPHGMTDGGVTNGAPGQARQHRAAAANVRGDTSVTPDADVTPGVTSMVGRGDTHVTRSISNHHRSSSSTNSGAAASSTTTTKPELATQQAPAAVARPRRRTHAETGLVYWLDDEPAEIDRLIAAHGLDAVRGAATAIASQGSDPLPSVVAKHLQAARRKAAQAEPVAPRQRGRTPEELAEDARKARAEMAAIAAQAGAGPAPRHTDTRTLETILAETWGIRS